MQLSKTGVRSYVVYDKGLDDKTVVQVAERVLEVPVHISDLTFEKHLAPNFPSKPIIKMGKRCHVDQFFGTGSLRLGTFQNFREHENEEVRDETEGTFLVASRNHRQTVFVEGLSGFDHYAFCTFIGKPSKDVLQKFGYDSCYRIDNPRAFNASVATKIEASDGMHAQCVYRRQKILVAKRANDEPTDVITARIGQLAGSAKFFIKPRRFQHQQEFRFVWQLGRDNLAPELAEVPDAVQYCTRLY